MNPDYVPIVKWKQGEQLGLQQLRPNERPRCRPLIEVIPGAVHGDPGPEGQVEDTSGTLVKNVIGAWGASPVFVDFSLLAPEWRPVSAKHPVRHFFEEARHVGQSWIPVTTLEEDDAYQAAVAAAVKEDGRGACIRVRFNDVVGATFAKDLRALRTILGLEPAEVDLLIDAGALGTANMAVMAVAARGAVATIEDLRAWRSVIFAGSSFPESLNALPYGPSTIVREEWRIWRGLQAIAANTRTVIFGDYTAASTALPSQGFVGSANIRYTIDDEWLILKGHKATDDEYGGYAQFYDLAEKLVKDVRFRGREFSWGDKIIDACAQRDGRPGNLSTWRAVATNHHITLVLDQLSRLATAGA